MSYADDTGKELKLGVNGFGRIGKLTVWHHVARKYFSEIVVNIGREVGTGLNDIAHYAERDSTYGRLHGYLYGCPGKPVIEEVDETDGSMRMDGIKVRFMRTRRNPKDIDWKSQKVHRVVDTTGQFLDPSLPADKPKGVLRGHLIAGASKVIASAPFKLKTQDIPMPEDAVITVMGINEHDFDPRRHKLISNASCTTTGAARALALVTPEMRGIGQRFGTFVKATIGVMCLPSLALAQYPESLIRTIQDISHNTVIPVLLCLIVLLCKSLRDAIIRPDKVETAFKEWAKFLGLRKNSRIWFVVLYVITGMAEYIGRKSKE